MSLVPCGKQPVLHLEPCCREEGHDGPCWPWTQVEYPSGGIWRITVVNAKEDGTAGGAAIYLEAIGGPAPLESLCAEVVSQPGYPEAGYTTW